MAKFSKKHFQQVAAILREVEAEVDSYEGHGGIGPHSVLLSLTQKLSALFQRDNAAFDREHFEAMVRGEKPLDSVPLYEICPECAYRHATGRPHTNPVYPKAAAAEGGAR